MRKASLLEEGAISFGLYGSGIHSRRIGAVKKRWEAKGRSHGVAALRFM